MHTYFYHVNEELKRYVRVYMWVRTSLCVKNTYTYLYICL